MADLSNINLNRKSIRNYLILFFAVLLTIMIGYFVIDFISKGQIKITTESNANIYIIKNTKNSYEKKLLSKGSYSGRYSKGDYSFVVELDDKSTIKTVAIEPLKTIEVVIELKNLSSKQLIINAEASDIQASNAELNYLNTSFYYFQKYIFGSKNAQLYPITQAKDGITSIQWVGLNKALLIFNNTSYAYLDNKNIKFFSPLPNNNDDSQSEDSDFIINQVIMNNNLEVLSQLNNEIYFQKTINSNATKLINIDKADSVKMALSNNDYFAYSSTFNLVDPSANKLSQRSNTDIFLARTSNINEKTIIESKSNVICLKFSPDSSKLLYCNGEGIFVYDINSKKSQPILTKMPQKPNTTLWVDDNNLIYYDNDSIWQMNTNNQVLYKIIYGPDIRYLISVSANIEKNKIFYTIKKPGATNTLSSVYSIDFSPN